MTETLETHDTATTPVVRRTSPLFRALAWVGIAAGSLFIVATVFFGGYVLGQHGGGGGGGHHGRHAMLIPPPPMGGPDGPMGPERLTPPSPSSQLPATPSRP